MASLGRGFPNPWCVQALASLARHGTPGSNAGALCRPGAPAVDSRCTCGRALSKRLSGSQLPHGTIYQQVALGYAARIPNAPYSKGGLCRPWPGNSPGPAKVALRTLTPLHLRINYKYVIMDLSTQCCTAGRRARGQNGVKNAL